MKKPNTAIFFLSVMLSSCAHYYYVPNAQNVPLFREKYEFRLSGAYGFGDYSQCSEFQTAFSLTDHIAMITNFMSAKGGKVSDNDDWAKGTYFDGALGYYKPFSEHGVFEIFGGLGGSNQHHHYSVYQWNSSNNLNSGTSDLSFTKLFIQPAIGVTFENIDFALSTRISRLSFNKINNQILESIDQSEYDRLNSLAQNKNHLSIEPALTLRAGFKNIKLQVQAIGAGYSNNNDYFETIHLSIGLSVAFTSK